MHRPRPGTIGLAKIGGALGAAIRTGQGMAGDLSMWTHAFVVVDEERVIEAQPGGARYASLNHYLQPGQAVFLVGWYDITDAQILLLQAKAELLIGTPYSFLDYLALAANALHIPAYLTRRRVTTSGHMICSQLADYLLGFVGIPLFDDGRLPQDVTPGDLHIGWTEAITSRALNTGWPTDTQPRPQDLSTPPHHIEDTPHGMAG